MPAWHYLMHGPWPMLITSVFFLLKNLAAFLQTRLKFYVVFDVATRLSAASAMDYLEGSFDVFTQTDSSVLQRKISQQPIEFAQYVLGGLQQLFTECSLIVISVTGIALFDAKVFGLLLLILLPGILLFSYITRVRLRNVREVVKHSSEKTIQSLNEILSGYVESNLYGKNKLFTNRYASFQRIMNRNLADLQVTQAIPSRLIELFAVAGLFLLVAVKLSSGAILSQGSWISISAFAAAAYKIIPGIVRAANISGLMKTYSFSVEGLPLPQKATIHERESLDPPVRAVEFRNVYFKYPNGSTLEEISFLLEPGDFIGLSGFSGKGKTTIINLLLGFLEPGRGDILINGKVMDAAMRRKFWKRIAYVKQQPFLLHESLQHNITLDHAEVNEERLRQVLMAAGLHSIADTAAAAETSIIREQGRNISGGQRQRTVIARALYKQADLVILDEPFNELDHSSENKMLEHFYQLAQSGKMIILITHRTESFSWCNKVISLHE